jgi:hypothetical protein
MLLLPHLVVLNQVDGYSPFEIEEAEDWGIPDSAGTIPEDYVAPDLDILPMVAFDRVTLLRLRYLTRPF